MGLFRYLRTALASPYLGWRYLSSLPKSLYFNLKYFPLRTAVRFPVLVSQHVWLKRMGGRVVLKGEPTAGRVLLGFECVGIFDHKRSRSIWAVDGEVVFQGRAILGHGTRLSVGPQGRLEFGDAAEISAEAAVVCQHRVQVGAGCLIGWETQIMDTDFHHLLGHSDEVLNHPRPVKLGERVWVGSRVTILKGAEIGDGSVVAAGTVVAGSFGPGLIIGGMKGQELARGVRWRSEG